MKDKSLFFAILYSCNRVIPQIMASSLDLDELKTQIVLTLNVDSGIYFTQQYKVAIFDDDTTSTNIDDTSDQNNVIWEDIPNNVSDISHEHIISITLSKEQLDIFKNNHVNTFLCGHEICEGFISIFKSSKPTVDFIDTLSKFNY